MAVLPDVNEIMHFHDERVADCGWGKAGAVRFTAGVWRWIEANHRCNKLLWDEEDRARRKNVPDSAIAANKRAIDGYNQRRSGVILRPVSTGCLRSARRGSPASRSTGSLLRSR